MKSTVYDISTRSRSLFVTRVGTKDKVVGERKFLGERRLGNKKLNKAKGREKVSNVALKYIILTKNISFDRLLLFEVMTII